MTDSMPAWFQDSFVLYFNIGLATDPETAAKAFWREIQKRERFPTEQEPDLSGNTGQRDICPNGHGSRVIGPLSHQLYECSYCERTFGNGLWTRYEGKPVFVAGP